MNDTKDDDSTKLELKHLTRSSFPLVVSFVLQYVFSITSVYAAGRLGAKELAACSLAICTFNITGLAVFQGMATSLDTFCSQAYGSGNKKMVGVYFQRNPSYARNNGTFDACGGTLAYFEPVGS